eukprot:629118-Hanusia_phi.AAC.1
MHMTMGEDEEGEGEGGREREGEGRKRREGEGGRFGKRGRREANVRGEQTRGGWRKSIGLVTRLRSRICRSSSSASPGPPTP